MRTVFKSLAIAAALAAPMVATAPISALAHHGWSSFDTTRAYYIKGTVTDVRWGNPHSEVTMTVDQTALPEGFRTRPLPPGSDERDGEATMASARAYDGDEQEIHLVLAGPSWMARWGLDRPLEVGETIEVLGYLGAADAHDLRPVMFWLEDGQGVWQQLTAFPSRPEPAN
ncbi:DUF6152 family protein [Donghicola mangrovi]|uniref:Uncharacterized protein n=1 Tax=Donghicola mangrovi TaxID=2729614 RepID=A0A850Q8G6_9RHOB|nr:DUF6152 family protein [Donghicola mangrovi]NVO25446.1 hypothetical protein [Donghicola mangrovi]